MKKLLIPLIILSICQQAQAQIVTASIKSNFGVEADLSANFYNNSTTPAVDDWFNNGYSGTGRGIIDTLGAWAILNGYNINPASRNIPFSRRMAYPAFALVNNRMMLDAVYFRDYHGSDSTIFASGSNKNGMNPASWTTPVAQSIPDKNDILEAMLHVRRAGPNVSDSLWLFAGVSIENTTGNRFFDFELYQTDIVYDKASGTFQGYGPDAGHTAWRFDSIGKISAPGDIIFTSEFSSSSISLVEARIWIDKAMLNIVPATFDWGGQFDGDGSGAQYGYANIKPKTIGSFYAGLQTTVPATWAGPFKVVRDNDAVVDNYIPGQFLEFSVNLTKLGIEPANYNQDACDPAFIRVIVKTRSSTSFTAELKDFVAPFKFFEYPPVDAFTFLTYFCGSMPQTELNVLNPNPVFTYTWTTSNGNIVGSNIGPVITVDAPGTYYVHQSPNINCVSSSMDSLTILFDSTCTVLNNTQTKLQAAIDGDKHKLNWTNTANEQVHYYIPEYSLDNINFVPLKVVPAGDRTGPAQFEVSHEAGLFASGLIFYRVKVSGKNGATAYSNISAIRKPGGIKENALVYPNPARGLLWLSFNSTKIAGAEINIFNSNGRLAMQTRLPVSIGENLLQLPDLAAQPAGVYLVKIKIGGTIISKKITLLK